MTTVFVSAWLGSGNAGDELIHAAMVAALRDRGVDRILAASLDPSETTRLHGVEAIRHTDLLAVGRAIRASDLVVVGGGGLLQDDTSLLSPPYQLHRPAIAAGAAIPMVGIGLGVGTLRPPSRVLARTVLSRAERLVVRDEPSRQRLVAAGLARVEVGADLVFSTPAPPVPEEPAVAVVLRPTFAPGGLLPGRWRVREPQADGRLAVLADQLDAVATRHGLRIRLVSMEPHRDTPHLEELARRLATPAELVEPGLDALAAIGSCRVVVSSRFHGVVAALHAARPVVALGYASKVEALASAAGPAAQLVPHDEAGATQVAAGVDRVLATDRDSRSAARRTMTERVRVDLAALDAALGRLD